jgi:dolichol-phosphate mannosyltransferase
MISVVVCTLNEAAAIGPVLGEVADALAGRRYEIIVVDDGSTDGTPDRVRALDDPRIRLIERRGVRGLASAAITGWNAAQGELLALMDGDGQHDPQLLCELIAALEGSSADLAVGVRDLSAEQALSSTRVWLSKAGVRLAGAALRSRITDPMSGYFVMRRSFYDRVRPRLSGVGFKILVDLIASADHRPTIVERTTTLRPRSGGTSKLDSRVIADLVALLLEKRLRSLVPARFILFTGVGLSGVAVNVLALVLFHRAGVHAAYALVGAIFVAMCWNFWLNNLLTFRDQRLRGIGLLFGFAGFVASCALGAVLNFLATEGVQSLGWRLAPAGLFGALAAGVFNFWAVRRVTWRVRS